jgi:hypothetical protein
MAGAVNGDVRFAHAVCTDVINSMTILLTRADPAPCDEKRKKTHVSPDIARQQQ